MLSKSEKKKKLYQSSNKRNKVFTNQQMHFVMTAIDAVGKTLIIYKINLNKYFNI